MSSRIFKLKACVWGCRGLTFFELLAAITILSTGIVMIYKGLFLTLDYQTHLAHRAYAMHWLDQQMVQIQLQYQMTGELPWQLSTQEHRARIDHREVPFKVVTHFRFLESLRNIVEMDITLIWRERNRDFRLSRSAYLSRVGL
jgi:hypothetical protein